MPKRMSKARKKLKEQKDWWKAQVRKRAKNKCQKCGKEGGKLDPHHLVYNKEFKWTEPKIGILLCSGCHKFGNESAHKGGFAFYDWFIRRFPKRVIEIRKMLNELV